MNRSAVQIFFGDLVYEIFNRLLLDGEQLIITNEMLKEYEIQILEYYFNKNMDVYSNMSKEIIEDYRLNAPFAKFTEDGLCLTNSEKYFLVNQPNHLIHQVFEVKELEKAKIYAIK